MALSRRDNSELELLSFVLRRELDRETRGWVSIFDGHIDPESGLVGEVWDVGDLTESGRMIVSLARTLHQIFHMRSVCRARLDAENLLMRR